MSDHPSYVRVFLTFARNSLVRDMTFRANFLIDTFTSIAWVAMNLGFYLIVFQYSDHVGKGWGESEFFVFIATTVIINSLVEAFFLPNASEFSELIRTGNLDFALLKPIDTQFLVSFEKIEWSSMSKIVFAVILMGYALARLAHPPGVTQVLLYGVYIVCGVAMFYSLIAVLSSITVWMGRNQNLYDFWFYITNFSRYPMEIYKGSVGDPLRLAFTFVVPILLVVNVPARMLAWPLEAQNWWLAVYAIAATIASLVLSRRLFLWALSSYRSASS
jgi:ABC-2 type transport system permease protein